MTNETADQVPSKRQEKSVSSKNLIPKHGTVEVKPMEDKIEQLSISGYRFCDMELLSAV